VPQIQLTVLKHVLTYLQLSFFVKKIM